MTFIHPQMIVTQHLGVDGNLDLLWAVTNVVVQITMKVGKIVQVAKLVQQTKTMFIPGIRLIRAHNYSSKIRFLILQML